MVEGGRIQPHRQMNAYFAPCLAQSVMSGRVFKWFASSRHDDGFIVTTGAGTGTGTGTGHWALATGKLARLSHPLLFIHWLLRRPGKLVGTPFFPDGRRRATSSWIAPKH